VSVELSCLDLMTCEIDCKGDAACFQKCKDDGSDQALTLYNTWDTCLKEGPTGACKDKCSDPSSTECKTCVSTECTDELMACALDTGPPMPGFGDVCTESSACKAPLDCVDAWGMAIGYCTKSCTTLGTGCSGTPAETWATCTLKNETTGALHCGFICKTAAATFKCPQGLKCGTEQTPPGTNQYICEPE